MGVTGRGMGQFPPDVLCAAVIEICNCPGGDHVTKWDEATGDFKGTRCERHGGHKFQPMVELLVEGELKEAFRALESAMINAVAAPGGMRCDELEQAVIRAVRG